MNFPQPVTEKNIRVPESSAGTSAVIPYTKNTELPSTKDGCVLFDEAVKIIQRAGKASAGEPTYRMNIGCGRADIFPSGMKAEVIIGKPGKNDIPRQVPDPGRYRSEKDRT